ncbi:unnamed protein product [Cochlearia groenlandica]
MDSLPSHIFDEILLKLDDPKSLSMIQCANRTIRSHISNDLYFKSKYISRFASELFHVSAFGSNIIFWHSSSDSWSTRNSDDPLPHNIILGFCSGLLLLFFNGQCVVTNPLKKKFYRFLDHSESKLFPNTILRFERSSQNHNHIGFAVDRNTQIFKIVCLSEQRNASNPEETTYKFEISNGESCCNWKLSDSTITCKTSNLMRYMKPIYLDEGAVHWLRCDGSIIAFDPKTEKARLIQIKSPPQNERSSSSKIMFTSTNQQELTLITATENVTCVYVLESDIFNDPEWVLVKPMNWNIACRGRNCLVVNEKKATNKERYNGTVFHVYKFRVNTEYYRLDCRDVVMKLICGFLVQQG